MFNVVTSNCRALAKNLKALASGKDLLTRLDAAERELAAAGGERAAAERVCRALLERHYVAWGPPPAELRLHVGAQDGLFNFWSKGLNSSDAVVRVFSAEPSGPILDWGCGSGRTAVWLWRFSRWRELYLGCDVDAAAVGWLREQGVDRVTTCDENPPLPYADGSLAGLFGFSVLTHIPPERHRSWYEEFRRVLRPGGVAYVTTHGALEADRSAHEVRSAFAARGAVFAVHPHENHYKDSSVVSEAFTRQAVDGLLGVVDFEESGHASQDAWTLSRP